MYSIEDKNDILRLQSIEEPTKADMDLTFLLTKKYVRPELVSYTTGCSCSNSITKLYQSLMEWYSVNESLFPN
jgi:hypothetical protein